MLETNLVYFTYGPRLKDLVTEYAAKNRLGRTQQYEQQQREGELSEGEVTQDLTLVPAPHDSNDVQRYDHDIPKEPAQ